MADTTPRKKKERNLKLQRAENTNNQRGERAALT